MKYYDFKMKHNWVVDLKLVNIMVGIGTNSSRYSCAFGECYKDKNTGFWIKGQERTISGINFLQQKWKDETKSNRNKLKFH